MNYTYLDNAFKRDARAVLLYPIKDYDNGLFLEVASTVVVEDIMIDAHMPSGYAVLFKTGFGGREYLVDKDFVIPYEDFAPIYNKVLDLALKKGRL
jgi:hypothetical protein